MRADASPLESEQFEDPLLHKDCCPMEPYLVEFSDAVSTNDSVFAPQYCLDSYAVRPSQIVLDARHHRHFHRVPRLGSEGPSSGASACSMRRHPMAVAVGRKKDLALP